MPIKFLALFDERLERVWQSCRTNTFGGTVRRSNDATYRRKSGHDSRFVLAERVFFFFLECRAKREQIFNERLSMARLPTC